MSATNVAGPLRQVLEAAIGDGVTMADVTVLSVPVDPYRLDTPANHAVGRWLREQMDRLDLIPRRLHLRGIHYALLGSTAMPDGRAYTNTGENWEWLQNQAAKAARWLKYVPFDAITDARNEPPVILAKPHPGPAQAWISVEPNIILPDIEDLDPQIGAEGFTGWQPYRLALYGEKSSLAPVLRPIAESYNADLYLPTGEISDTQMHQMAANAAADGRPLVVFTVSDFDPAGHQMPISIARKLQAFRDLLFPDLEFKVLPVALTREQVEELDLPSTPLKESERRADKWRAAMGHEQVEIDALATLRPDVLNKIVREAIKPFYDTDLDHRVFLAKANWQDRAEQALADQLDDTNLAALRDNLADQIDVIRRQLREIEDQARLSTADLDIDLPQIEVPVAEIDEGLQGKPLISSDWSFEKGSRALIARKSYREASI